MAIAPNSTITYGDLIQQVLNHIFAVCQNIDTLKNIPSGFITGTYNPNIFHWTEMVTNPHCGMCHHAPGESLQNRWIVGTVISGIEAIPKQRVINQFNAFITQRGIASRVNQLVSTKGLLHFYNTVSSFYTERVCIMTASGVNKKVIFYYDGSVTYVPVPDGSGGSNSELIVSNDINALLQNLNMVLNKTSKAVSPKYSTLAYKSSCSCSSCSSSSCSSSSCSSSSSSSSSWFIGYMKI